MYSIDLGYNKLKQLIEETEDWSRKFFSHIEAFVIDTQAKEILSVLFFSLVEVSSHDFLPQQLQFNKMHYNANVMHILSNGLNQIVLVVY